MGQGTQAEAAVACLYPHLLSTLSTKTPGFVATLPLEREAEVSRTGLSFFTTEDHPIERETGPPSFLPPALLPCRSSWNSWQRRQLPDPQFLSPYSKSTVISQPLPLPVSPDSAGLGSRLRL